MARQARSRRILWKLFKSIIFKNQIINPVYVIKLNNKCQQTHQQIQYLMQTNILQESPRIAKISSSAQQFRELINSLRNNQHALRNQSSKNAQSLPIASNNHSEIAKPAVSNEKEVLHNSIVGVENKEEDQALKLVPKVQVGGRDQLKKIKATFDAKPQKAAPLEFKKQASVQMDQKQINNIPISFESPRKNVSTQCQIQQNNTFHFPQSSFSLHSSRVNQKAGQIKRQNIMSDFSTEPEQKNTKKIRDISQKTVIEYYKKQKIVEKSQPSEIFSFFTNLCMNCDIIIKSPTIKKFKNCIYFGFPIIKDQIYEGFLHFYDSRVYYGEFLNGLKHGLGVELNINEEIKYKGEFTDGRKNGKFFVQKPGEKYIGYLQNGLYQGEGRLTTADYIYQGLFEQGQKNGYGQQYYPKTGVKISGMFKNGILAKAKASKSISEMRSKSKVGISKQKQKDRLEIIRKKSLEKHNSRMNKVRSFRESEYEIQFDTQAEYNELPKIHFNANKLEVYRQPLQKLPKINHDLEYSFEKSRNFQSISNKSIHNAEVPKPNHREKYLNGPTLNPQRQITNEYQQPLPTPCLSFIRKDHR